jgi:hypothetical protein
LFYTEAAFIKKIQARGGQCWGKITRKRGKGEREKRKRQGEKQRSDKEQTEKKIWTTYIVHI